MAAALRSIDGNDHSRSSPRTSARSLIFRHKDRRSDYEAQWVCQMSVSASVADRRVDQQAEAELETKAHIQLTCAEIYRGSSLTQIIKGYPKNSLYSIFTNTSVKQSKQPQSCNNDRLHDAPLSAHEPTDHIYNASRLAPSENKIALKTAAPTFQDHLLPKFQSHTIL